MPTEPSVHIPGMPLILFDQKGQLATTVSCYTVTVLQGPVKYDTQVHPRSWQSPSLTWPMCEAYAGCTCCNTSHVLAIRRKARHYLDEPDFGHACKQALARPGLQVQSIL